MISVDLRRYGRFLLALPGPTLRAFGTSPRAWRLPVADFATRALLVRVGSVFVWVMPPAQPGAIPLAIFLEVQTLPGFSVRAAWMREERRGLRELLFPDQPPAC